LTCPSSSTSTNKCEQNGLNLIDLNTDIQTEANQTLKETQDLSKPGGSSSTALKADHQYVNCSTDQNEINESLSKSVSSTCSSVKDPFDMQPFNSAIGQQDHSIVSDNYSQLQTEEWYHGVISRKESESLVVKDGDFLVRESQGSSGQFVLTGMQGGIRKHLLLVDPEGVVRTKDKTFESVSHLINYHRDNGLPIISAESALVLRNPVVVKR